MGDFTTEWERPEFDSVPSLAENAVYLLPGCDDTVLRKTLQVIYRDFCRRSAAMRTWRRIPLEAGVCAYPVAPLLSGEIDCVTRVVWAHSRAAVNGWRVVGDAPPMLELPRGFARHSIDVSMPDVVWVQEKENVAATPVEVSNSDDDNKVITASVLVEAVEIPHIGEERAPKEFLRRYGDVIVNGAIARMMSMPNRPWSNPEQALIHATEYQNTVSETRLRMIRGGNGANACSGFAVDMSGAV